MFHQNSSVCPFLSIVGFAEISVEISALIKKNSAASKILYHITTAIAIMKFGTIKLIMATLVCSQILRVTSGSFDPLQIMCEVNGFLVNSFLIVN